MKHPRVQCAGLADPPIAASHLAEPARDRDEVMNVFGEALCADWSDSGRSNTVSITSKPLRASEDVVANSASVSAENSSQLFFA